VRPTDSEKQELALPIPEAHALSLLAERATYQGIAKHKIAPLRFGIPLFQGRRSESTYCDLYAGFEPSDMAKVPRWMKNGIRTGLVHARLINADPAMLWAIGDEGWIYEARLTIPGQAVYHGYPMLPHHAFAQQVLERFRLWAADKPAIMRTVDAALNKYDF